MTDTGAVTASLNAIHPLTRAEWRAWLEENHGRVEGVWLISYKKATGKPRIEYDEAVEEALCYGWIDSKPNKLDAEQDQQMEVFRMTPDRSYVELNRASTNRMRDLAASLTDEALQHPVGEHWTVAITLVHLAWWDARVSYVLNMTERNGALFVPQIDLIVNDLSLPFWAAIPPRAAAQLAIAAAESLDERLANYPPALLDEIYAYNKRWVVRALHRGEHLDEVDAALNNR